MAYPCLLPSIDLQISDRSLRQEPSRPMGSRWPIFSIRCGEGRCVTQVPRVLKPRSRGSCWRREACPKAGWPRSEEHTCELQSLMRLSYAVFRLKKTIHISKNLSNAYR